LHKKIYILSYILKNVIKNSKKHKGNKLLAMKLNLEEGYNVKTELTGGYLQKNILATREKLEELEAIDKQIAEIYKEPVTEVQKKMITAFVNLAWISIFSVMAFNFLGYHLLLMPILYWVFRGSIISERVSNSLYKKQLDDNEALIDSLYRQKGDKEYELKTISMLETELHNIAMLKQFEAYLQTKQAVTIDKCIELYDRDEKVKIL